MKKKCKVCGNENLSFLFSIDKYWCGECRKFYPFKLKPGQKSILIKGRVGQSED